MGVFDDPEAMAQLSESIGAVVQRFESETQRLMAAVSHGPGVVSSPYTDGSQVSTESVELRSIKPSVWERHTVFDRAQEALRAEADRRYAAEVAAEEARLRERFAAAVIAGLEEQARQHPGFNCESTSERDMFAVSGILSVSELVEAAVRALRES